MKTTQRKGLTSIRTRTGRSTAANGSHRQYLQLASLELQRGLCNQVKAASSTRLEEMEKKLAEIDAAQAALLPGPVRWRFPDVSGARAPLALDTPAETAGAGGVKLRY